MSTNKVTVTFTTHEGTQRDDDLKTAKIAAALTEGAVFATVDFAAAFLSVDHYGASWIEAIVIAFDTSHRNNQGEILFMEAHGKIHVYDPSSSGVQPLHASDDNQKFTLDFVVNVNLSGSELTLAQRTEGVIVKTLTDFLRHRSEKRASQKELAVSLSDLSHKLERRLVSKGY